MMKKSFGFPLMYIRDYYNQLLLTSHHFSLRPEFSILMTTTSHYSEVLMFVLCFRDVMVVSYSYLWI
uniref:Putative ovule protein n=1 Tax=Solanum chacoense TaxID=4108 RepID=A0A0V0GZH5_SOLCH